MNINWDDDVIISRSFGDPKAGIYAFCYMQVCVRKGVSDEDILRVCNADNPSGTSNGWTRVIRADEDHWPGPTQCADQCDREHILVLC